MRYWAMYAACTALIVFSGAKLSRYGDILAHTLSAGFGILLLGIVSLGLILRERSLPIGWIGGYSLLLLGVYLVAMRMIHIYEKKRVAAFAKERSEEPGYEEIPMRSALLNYAVHAGIIILAASVLPLVGKGIAESTALGQTFVGNIFIVDSSPTSNRSTTTPILANRSTPGSVAIPPSPCTPTR